MDVREILIANSKTQKRYKVNTAATTLGELKAALDAEGIDYEGLTFTEGISKTQLTSDDSQLPTNVMYKGAPTNNLVILLTNTVKNIPSGALSRKEIYTLIREYNLSDDLKDEFGNWTIITTEALEDFIRNNYDILDEDDDESVAPKKEVLKPHDESFDEALYYTLKTMVAGNYLNAADIRILVECLTELAAREAECAEPVTASHKETRHPAEIVDDEINSKIDEIMANM